MTGGAVLSFVGVIAAIASLSCCVVPFALFLMGISGAWIANLTALAPFKPAFVILALILLGAGFFRVYRRPKAACADGSYCASPRSTRAAKGMLWLACSLVVLSLAFPYVVRLAYGG
jgi:mercuric ion transport protein